MKLKNSFFAASSIASPDEKALFNPDIGEARSGYIYAVHQKLYGSKIKELIGELKPKTNRGLFYAGGAMEHHSLGRKFPIELQESSVLIKSQSSVAAWSWAKLIGGISFVTINANTCASSMYSIFEAYQAIKSGALDEAIVIAEEWVEPLELMMFRQMGIDIVCSDGFCMLHFVADCKEPMAEIEDIYFRWIAESSPFGISKDSYAGIMSLALSSLDDLLTIDGVKMHASGTQANDKAELEAIKELFGDIKTLEYKSRIGHSQGASSALELAMMVDEGVKGKWLVNAAGLGGFYGCAKVKL